MFIITYIEQGLSTDSASECNAKKNIVMWYIFLHFEEKSDSHYGPNGSPQWEQWLILWCLQINKLNTFFTENQVLWARFLLFLRTGYGLVWELCEDIVKIFHHKKKH